MPLEGFGSEASLTAIILLGLKVARDWVKERRERRSAAKVVSATAEREPVANGSNPGNPGRRNPGNPRPSSSRTSTDLVLHVLEEHGEKLHTLEHKVDVGMAAVNKDMTDVKVNLAKVNTKLEIK